MKLSLNKSKISEFIKKLPPCEDSFSSSSFGGILFSLQDYGSLWLTKDEVQDYRSILKSIIKDADLDVISGKEIEKLFQRAILKSIDLENRHPDLDFDSCIKNSIDELENLLKATPKIFILYYPIEGLEKSGLPYTFGKIEFKVFDESDFSLFKNAILDFEGNEKEKKIRKDALKDFEEKGLINKIVAKIRVNVVDYEAGINQAKKELALTIDVLNFFSDLIPYHEGFIYLPGKAHSQVILVPLIEDSKKPSFHFNYRSVGPLMPVNINKLIETYAKNNNGLAIASKLLSANRNEFQDRLLSALRWAGSATSEIDNEKSFLGYAISLETLILQEGNDENISYKIRTRIAQLLSENYIYCCKIERHIKDLYKIRSSIVHNGEYQVADGDLSLIRYYSKNCIVKLLVNEEFKDISQEEFLRWFLKRTYR